MATPASSALPPSQGKPPGAHPEGRRQASRRTSLYERHVAQGARMVEFAGWEMPVQYPDGVRAEHMAVRERCGIFDVSHMGEVECAGPGAQALLQRLLSNDVDKIPVGGAQYSLLCREDGGVLDDLFSYCLEPDRYLTVTNASNHSRDLAWFEEHAGDFDVQVVDRLEAYAMLAVQGPRAREVVQAISDTPLPPRMTAGRRRMSGADVLVCGTGYTGEDGVELLLAPERAPALWDELVRRGAVPCGLAARDTLRLEACFHLYGNDLSLERNPIEAGLGWCCREDTGFIGAEAVRSARSDESVERLVAFAIDGGGIARQGNPVMGGGVVTSGTMSPCLAVGVGMAYVPAARSAIGSRIEIDVRGKIRPATIAAKPLYRKD
ncbi:MAG TPA: glycine cleavage system aminomethyltransferase GcvT [Solirubrobacteraceae bacterium]|nr:glycine cleavage system aminomethyltransferase GcvT [Solirubrobacteraceae bacterium]